MTKQPGQENATGRRPVPTNCAKEQRNANNRRPSCCCFPSRGTGQLLLSISLLHNPPTAVLQAHQQPLSCKQTDNSSPASQPSAAAAKQKRLLRNRPTQPKQPQNRYQVLPAVTGTNAELREQLSMQGDELLLILAPAYGTCGCCWRCNPAATHNSSVAPAANVHGRVPATSLAVREHAAAAATATMQVASPACIKCMPAAALDAAHCNRSCY